MTASNTPAPRRSQARSEVSRARIIEAATLCVDREGLPATTSAAIAREAGLSVGAVQHHYPSKDDVLGAVVAESAARFAACFAGAPAPPEDLDARAHAFIERAWRHYDGPFFRAAQEIVLGGRRNTSAPPESMVASARVAEGVWHAWFGDLPLTRAVQRDLRRACFASLTGLAMLARFEPKPKRLDGPLAHVKTGLAASLRQAAETARRP